MNWRYVPGGPNKKPKKVPYSPGTGNRANVTDLRTWGTFEQAANAFLEGGYNGAGFVLTQDLGLTGFDLDKDNCRDPTSGAFQPWASDILNELNSYSEVTPSGAGTHTLVWGSLPPGRRRNAQLEVYDDGRYFTVTGCHLAGTPSSIESRQAQLLDVYGRHFPSQHRDQLSGLQTPSAAMSDQEVLSHLAKAKNKGKFHKLWAGHTDGYVSPSEADFALTAMIAFYTQDPNQIEQILRQSGLRRGKWDEHPTYLNVHTIPPAIKSLLGVFRPGTSLWSSYERDPSFIRDLELLLKGPTFTHDEQPGGGYICDIRGRTYTPIEAYRSHISGRPPEAHDELLAPTYALYRIRLAAELGRVQLHFEPLPELPSSASPAAILIYQAYGHVRACHTAYAGEIQPVPLSYDFLQNWLPTDRNRAVRGLRWLLENHCLILAGRMGPMQYGRLTGIYEPNWNGKERNIYDGAELVASTLYIPTES